MSRWRTLFPQVPCVVTGSVVLTSPTGGFNVADDRCRLSNRCQEYGLYTTCWDSLSGCPHTLHTDTHFTCILYSSCCNASCLYGWMGAWFEACLWSPLRQGTGSDGFMFHDMLYWHSALLSLPGSSRVCPANSNRIHPKLTTLYNSPFAFLILFLLILFFIVSHCLKPPCMSSSLSLSHTLCCSSVSLPLSSWVRSYLPCALWRGGSCLNRTAMMLACVPPAPWYNLLAKTNCVLSSAFQMKSLFFCIMVLKHLLHSPSFISMFKL